MAGVVIALLLEGSDPVTAAEIFKEALIGWLVCESRATVVDTASRYSNETTCVKPYLPHFGANITINARVSVVKILHLRICE